MTTSYEPARGGERGAVTWVTLLLIAGLAAGGYLLRVWAPVWMLNYEVKQVVRDLGNQAIKNPDDAELLATMCQRLRGLERGPALLPDGTVEVRPMVEVAPQEVIWERDASAVPPRLRVAFSYRRWVRYPILDDWREVEMPVDIVSDLTRADWGKP